MPNLQLTTRQFGPNPKNAKLSIQEMDENLLYLDGKYQLITFGTINYQDINNLFGLNIINLGGGQLPGNGIPIQLGLQFNDIVLQNAVDPSSQLVSLFINESEAFGFGYYETYTLPFWLRQSGSDIIVTPVLNNYPGGAFTTGLLEVKGLITPVAPENEAQ